MNIKKIKLYEFYRSSHVERQGEGKRQGELHTSDTVCCASPTPSEPCLTSSLLLFIFSPLFPTP